MSDLDKNPPKSPLEDYIHKIKTEDGSTIAYWENTFTGVTLRPRIWTGTPPFYRYKKWSERSLKEKILFWSKPRVEIIQSEFYKLVYEDELALTAESDQSIGGGE